MFLTWFVSVLGDFAVRCYQNPFQSNKPFQLGQNASEVSLHIILCVNQEENFKSISVFGAQLTLVIMVFVLDDLSELLRKMVIEMLVLLTYLRESLNILGTL